MSISRADFTTAVIAALILMPSSALAQSKDALDPIPADALEQTRKRLANQAHREEDAAKTPEAANAHSDVKSTVGHDPRLTDETYNLASDILGTLVQEADGDPNKLKDVVDSLSRDPRSLERRLTPQQRQAIRDLASKAEKSRGGVGSPR